MLSAGSQEKPNKFRYITGGRLPTSTHGQRSLGENIWPGCQVPRASRENFARLRFEPINCPLASGSRVGFNRDDGARGGVAREAWTQSVGESDKYLGMLKALRPQLVEVDANNVVIFENRDQPTYKAGRNLLDQLPECTAKKAREAIEHVRSTGEPSTFVAQHGSVPIQISVMGLGEEAPGHVCLSFEEKRRSEEEELEERRRLEVALHASGVGLWSWHIPSGRVVWDDRMREITGRESPLTLPEWIERLTHPEDRAQVREESPMGVVIGDFRSSPARIVREDGEVRWVVTAGTTIAGENDAPEWVVGGLTDVTEQQRLSEKLQEAHKMEALGHLTGGVAHNFNNMLMIIEPCLEMIRDTAQGELRKDVDDALQATQRATEIVAQLMTFAGRQNQRERQTKSVALLCEESVRLCSRSFPKAVTLESKVETTALVECIPGALEQVLGNLLLNARDAVTAHRGSGRVVLHAMDHDEFEDGWVMITVSDDGPGVPASLRGKVFEPFVTTKAGKGTGLGLASSMTIVQQHGGQLAYRPSTLGGAEFLMLVPRQGRDSDAVVPGQPDTESSPQQGMRVLVVDDEPALRRLVKSGLTRYGYVVESAGSVAEAEKALEELDDFGAVLLDRSLGPEDGADLVPTIRSRMPGARLYFFTGEFVSSDEAATVDGVIQKPLNIRKLAEVLLVANNSKP